MKITTQIKEQEYVKWYMMKTYGKVHFITVGVYVLFLVCLAVFSNKEKGAEYLSMQVVIPVVVMLTVYFVVKYFFKRKVAARNFHAYPMLAERMDYTFLPDTLDVKGESFTSTLTWDKIDKVVEQKDWFLIYQSAAMANLIPKSGMTATEINALRSFFSSKRELKVKLLN